MKTIGLIGGVGWPSTLEYYEHICSKANTHFGDLTSPDLIVYNLNFEPIKQLQLSGQWEASAQPLIDAGNRLEAAGADAIGICSVTTNIAAEFVEQALDIPLISIVDPIANAIQNQQLSCVGLLGTKPTMEYPFFVPQLRRRGINVLVPEAEERDNIHGIIYQELCLNILTEESKQYYQDCIGKLQERGAQGIILGCTEIPLLLSQDDVHVPLFNCTQLHADALTRYSLDLSAIADRSLSFCYNT